MQSILACICCCFTAILIIPTTSARVILPLSVVAAQSAGLDVDIDPEQTRFAPPLAVDANSLYSTRPIHDLEVENAGTEDADGATMDVNGHEDFVNVKVRRIARLMRGKHPPYVRFG